MRYIFLRYWFRFVSRPCLDTDMTSKHFVCLQDVLKTSSRHVFKTSSRHVFKMSSRHVFNTYSRRLQRNNFLSSKNSWRRLQDVFKMPSRRLGRQKNCYAEDILKTSSRHVLKTNKCLLGTSTTTDPQSKGINWTLKQLKSSNSVGFT